MKILDAVQRVVLLLFLVPVVFVVVHTVLAFFEAREDNAVVRFFAAGADRFTWEPLESMFVDQGLFLTAVLTLAFWGIAAGAATLVFKGIRAVLRPLLTHPPGSASTTSSAS